MACSMIIPMGTPAMEYSTHGAVLKLYGRPLQSQESQVANIPTGLARIKESMCCGYLGDWVCWQLMVGAP